MSVSLIVCFLALRKRGCFTVNYIIAFMSVSLTVCFLTLRKRGCWVLYGELYYCFYVSVSDCLFSYVSSYGCHGL